MSAQTFDNFVGGSYAALTPNLAADTAVNLYYESAESGTGKNKAALMGAPGLQAFTTLPTQPVRGMLMGDAGLYVVSGAIYYQVFADGTFQARGSVGTDALNSPVQMFINGGQVFIVSAGLAYCDGGGAGGLGIPADWAEIAGACNTSGTAVTWTSGFKFPSDAAGFGIQINGVAYVVASVTDSTHLVLTSSAGTQTGVLWYGPGGPVPAMYQNGGGTVTTAGTAVTWVSGSTFDASNVGNVFYVSGARYTVASVTDPTHLVLTSSAGTQGSTFTGTCDTAGTAVTWDSGSTFTGLIAGQVITIATVPYTIASITDSTHLVLASTAPALTAAAFTAVDGVPYTSAYGVTASCGAFLDGYYIIAVPGTRKIQISAINDGKSWNPLDFAIKEAYPDGIQALLADHEQLWLMGDQTCEVWQDTGAAAFPFQRIPGAFVQMGICAPYTATKFDGTVAWLGGDSRGRAVAYAANGFIPVRISTHAVETAWAQGAVGDAIAFAYSDQGHEFWVVSFPSVSRTWVYDGTEKLWHERGWWDGTQLNRVRGAFCGFVFDQYIAGDWETGRLYYQSTSLYDDAGVPIYHERAAPHVSGPMLGLAQPGGTSTNSQFQDNTTFYHRFRLEGEFGLGSGGVMSDDYTTSWIAQTSVVVKHNLATTAVCIEVMDSTGLVTLPESVTVQDANTAVLTFGAAFTGAVIVIKGTPGTTSYSLAFAGTTGITVTHGLGTAAVIVQVYNVLGLLVEPESTTVIDPNQVVLTFAGAMGGSVVVIKGSYTAAWVAQTAVIATHNLGTTAVEVQCYASTGLQVNPETMRVTSSNTVTLAFAAAFTGYVVVWASTATAQPSLILDWSDDGGHTFGTQHPAPPPYKTFVDWRRLGQAPDRVFRVRYLTRGKVAFINAYLQSTAGSR
jgi:hypothetical protein